MFAKEVRLCELRAEQSVPKLENKYRIRTKEDLERIREQVSAMHKAYWGKDEWEFFFAYRMGAFKFDDAPTAEPPISQDLSRLSIL